MFKIFTVLFVLVFTVPSYAQQSEQHAQIEKFSEAIEDNSFYIEEAYNQEAGVVQHISNGIYFSKPQKDFTYTFTQEWPLSGQTHQLSYTIPYSFLNSNSTKGIGDIFIHYRYQIWDQEDFIAFSPRLSVILPVGNKDNGLGDGSMGLQVNLPFSRRISEKFALHFNVGSTILFNKSTKDSNGIEIESSPISYNIGASAIWLLHQNFNFMLEALNNQNQDFNEKGELQYTSETIISPGFRYAINIGETQIVPGIAMPISFSEGNSRSGIFLYLSVEHPF